MSTRRTGIGVFCWMDADSDAASAAISLLKSTEIDAPICNALAISGLMTTDENVDARRAEI